MVAGAAAGGPRYAQPAYSARPAPVACVERAGAPLLTLHGERDDTCPVRAAEGCFAARRMQRKEAMPVDYPGEARAFIQGGRPPTRRDAHAHRLARCAGHLG